MKQNSFEEIEKEIENLLGLAHENHESIQAIAASRYMDYAASIILGRAIPDINDGLKPVHRRILQTMKDLHLSPSGSPKKSARIVGQTLGLYHPHGDSSVYEAMVGLTQPWNKMLPLVIGQGNFGSVDGDNAAAQRYTEAKLSKAGALFFQDMEKNVVDFKDNYDFTEKEPVVLPVPFPNLLINGGSGIAAGMATNIPTHNPKEVLDALIYTVKQMQKNRPVSAEKIFSFIKAPDFPTGGIVYNSGNMLDIIKTGRGSIRLRAKYHTEKVGKKKEAIIVTEIPFQVNKVKLIKEIVNLVKDRKNDFISTIRDESNKEGMRIYIELKNGADPELVWNFLVKNSQLDISVNYNMTVTKDKSPKETNIIEVLEDFVLFRKNIINRRYLYIKNQALSRLEIVNGLLIALEDIDNVINLIKKSETEEKAISGLIDKYSLSERQAKAILDMRIQKLIGMEKTKLEAEKENLEETIKNSNVIIDSDDEKYKIIIEESRKLKKDIGFDRKAEIDDSLSNIDMEDIIPKEDCVIYLSHKGYLRRIPVSEINRQNRGTKGKKRIELQEEDFILKTFNTNSHSILLFITEKGKVFASKAYKIPNNVKGRFVANIFEIDEGDRVVNVCEVGTELSDQKNIVFATEKGFVKQTSLNEYSGAFRTSGVIGIKLSEEDNVSFVSVSENGSKEDIVLINSIGKLIRFGLDQVSNTGRNTRGVIGMRLSDEEKVIGGAISSNDSSVIFNIGEFGTVKASMLSEYKKQNRGGKGVYAMRISKKTGNLIKALIVEMSDLEGKELVLTSKNGLSNRISLDMVKVQSRLTSGLVGMKVNKGDYVIDAFITEPNEEEIE